MNVELGPFYRGVACGTRVNDAHKDTEFTDRVQRSAFFWFAAGMLAAGEYGITNLGDENAEFLAGVATQAPSLTETSDEDETVDA